jgi:ATP-binding cassette subfamily C protein
LRAFSGKELGSGNHERPGIHDIARLPGAPALKIAGVELPPMLADAVRSCRPHFVAAATFSLLLNVLFLAPSLYMLQVYDRVVTSGSKMTLLFITLALLIALLTLSSLDAIRNRLLIRAGIRLDEILAPKIVKRSMASRSRVTAQTLRDFDTVRQTVSSPVIAAIFDLPWAPVFLIVAFMFHWLIGVLALVSAALLVVVAWRSQRASRQLMEVGTAAMAASHSAAQSVASNAMVVRALGMTGAMVDRQLSHRRYGLKSVAEAQFVGGRYSALTRFLRMFVQSAALGLGALLAIEGEVSSGAIIASSILLSRALQPIEQLTGGWSSLLSARAALDRMSEALGPDAEIERIYTELPAPEGRLEVEQVSVRGSDGQPVLFGVSMSARPGELIGIIGPSGSGKTTLAKVIAGALPADAGTVRIDGAQLADWEHDRLGRHIGYMPQEPSLFEGTIKDNIARFSTDAPDGRESTDEAAIRAAKLAGVHDMILRLPKGYDTRLGPMGSGLSAGQAQRVALARALYGDPALIILDEPNAFLDSDGEDALLAALTTSRARKATVLLIAHRKSILQAADRLLVLEAGRPKLFGPAREVAARLAGPPAKESAA